MQLVLRSINQLLMINNYILKILGGLILGLLGLGILFSVKIKSAHAETLESDSYIIQFGNFNVTSGEKESATYKVSDTVGQTGAGPYGQYGSSGYFVGSGFQYIYQIKQFSFTLSKMSIDLGLLATGAHNTDSHLATITTRGAGGYTVYAYETHPLLHQNNVDTIPDTTCDAGACDETTAGIWTDTDIGGFGFNADGSTAASDFLTTNHFRQFANDEAAESMQPVMTSNDIAIEDQATITYKAGLSSGSQVAGLYETNVVYVAVPGY